MNFDKPIPKIDFTVPKVSFRKVNERLVDISLYNNGKITVEPMYFKQGIKGASNKCLVREAVAKMLCEASEKLPDGMGLKIFDGWRPFEVQKYLFDGYRDTVRKQNPDLTDSEIDLMTQQFVSLPKKDEFDAPVHSSGGRWI